jgi:hypothetical protein
MSGFSFFTREAKPLMEPTIDGGMVSTDAYRVLPRQIFCFQIWWQDIKYIFPFASFQQLFATEKIFLNFTIIYISYKCYNITFMGEACWLINLDRETVIFSVYHTKPLQHHVICHQYVYLSSSYCLKVEHFQFFILHLVPAFYPLALLGSHQVCYFLFQAISSAAK